MSGEAARAIRDTEGGTTESDDGAYLLAVDVGGTHTDIELRRINSSVSHHHKLPSTPAAPAAAVTTGIREILELADVSPSQVRYFAHGTTVAANAVVQGKCAPTALIATAGFRDLLEIRRQRQPHAYDVQTQKPAPPVPRRWRREISERQFLFGRSSKPPRREEVAALAEELVAQGVKSVAVCLLHSYVDPGHERRVGEWLEELAPDLYCSLSCDVLPEFREYERTSTTVLNAALGPVMTDYLQTLASESAQVGLRVQPRTMQSNGGLATSAQASELPVRTLASGPAAGVIGAIDTAKHLDEADIITFDVGGTTADVCLVTDGQPSFAAEREIAGYPVRSPMIDVLSVGAGGGSIAWIDPGGFLQVGPQSAGALPGPVCYRRGGTEPTVTDANLVLGWLNQTSLLDGRLAVDRDAAADAISTRVAEPLGLSLEQAASGILSILNENMMQAVRVTSVERGHDPREFSLVAFGGGGPLLAGRLAGALEMPRVIIPAHPGLLCAQGLLVADLRTDLARSQRLLMTAESTDSINRLFAALEADAAAWFDRNHVSPAERRMSFAVDMRYLGQSHELTVHCSPDSLDADGVGRFTSDTLRAGFAAEHRRRYGFAPDDPMEAITFRAAISAPGQRTAFGVRSIGVPAEPAQPTAHRQVFCDIRREWTKCPVYHREDLCPGQRLDGPAVIEQMDSTAIARSGESIEVTAGDTLCLYPRGSSRAISERNGAL